MPSGRRDAALAPTPIAIGSVPTIADTVVIMIGRKRTLAASTIASRRRDVLAALPLEREVDHHDRVLLHDADQHDDADVAVHAELDVA